MNNDIIKVWGRADAYALEYSLCPDGLWEVSVPPDLTDGQYAAEIWARNRCGETGYWSGFLFMHRGRAKLYLIPRKYSLWMQPPRVTLTASQPLEIHFERSVVHARTDI